MPLGLDLRKLTNVTLIGTGTTIVMHARDLGIVYTTSCLDVATHDLTFEYATPHYAQGIVRGYGPTSTAASRIDVEFDSNYPDPLTDPYLQRGCPM